jgi:hypothetical protein
MLPKFPDKQRRPGIIHLPQPLATPPHSTSKLPALNPSQKQQSQAQTQTPVILRKGNPQLRTPSPNASPRRQPHSNSNNRRKQKRTSVGNIILNIPEPAQLEAPLSPQHPPSSLVAVVVPRPGLIMLSPPPTPAVRASNKSSKKNAKNKAQNNHVRNVSKQQQPLVLPVSPPLTPEAPQVCSLSISIPDYLSFEFKLRLSHSLAL